MSVYDDLVVSYHRCGKLWGYVDVDDYHIEVVEFGVGFGWKLHRFPSAARSVFVAAGYCGDVEVAWREACAACDAARSG